MSAVNGFRLVRSERTYLGVVEFEKFKKSKMHNFLGGIWGVCPNSAIPSENGSNSSSLLKVPRAMVGPLWHALKSMTRQIETLVTHATL
jgi:hypothetical protein